MTVKTQSPASIRNEQERKEIRMNERIRELAEQAEEIVFHSPSTGRTTKQLNIEKFALLIVSKCAEVADTADATRKKWEGIGKYVREYFEIEE